MAQIAIDVDEVEEMSTRRVSAMESSFEEDSITREVIEFRDGWSNTSVAGTSTDRRP